MKPTTPEYLEEAVNLARKALNLNRKPPGLQNAGAGIRTAVSPRPPAA